MLSKIQGALPERMYLIDGSDIIHKYKTKEFLDFYLFTKNNFEIYLKNISKENIYPEKNSNCAVCDYTEVCGSGEGQLY